MNVTIEKCGDELIAVLAGEIDHHNSKQIREAIDAELERGGYKLLTFDLESVSFMDSSGIGLVMGRWKLMRDISGRVVIENAPKAIKKVMKMSGIEKLISMQDKKEGSFV